MASKFATTTKDLGYSKAMKTFHELDKNRSSVTIGVHEETGAHDTQDDEAPVTVAEVATWMEFGTETTPERSFMRSTVDEHFESYVELSKRLQWLLIQRKLVLKQALGLMGEQIQSDIVAKINSNIAPANADETVARKGSSSTLIDSGQLKQSIRYVVNT